MLKFSEFLTERVKLSDWRPLVKGWDSKRLEQEFKNEPHDKDKHAFRLFLPTTSSAEQSVSIPPPIKSFLDSEGYDVVNYAKGLVKRKNSNREIKISKILNNDPDLFKTFVNDPNRTASRKTNKLIAISRHPYDIAGMSTDRGWTSCFDLEAERSWSFYVPREIKEGTLVAYLIDETDKNIENPIGRIAIKPLVNMRGETYYVLSNKPYGSFPATDLKVLEDWVESFNSKRGIKGLFIIDQGIYDETRARKMKIGELSEIEKIIGAGQFSKLKSFGNLPEFVQLFVLKQGATFLQYINNPTDKVKKLAVEEAPGNIGYFEKQSEELQMMAVQSKKAGRTIINYLKNPSQKVLDLLANLKK